MALALLVWVAGCTYSTATLSTVPLATPMASHRSRGDIAVTGRAGTVLEPAQENPNDVDLFVPRGQLEATSTIRLSRFFALRPIVELGFAQGAMVERGTAGEEHYGWVPSIVTGPGLLFRIEASEDVDVDLELDPLLGAVVDKYSGTCLWSSCSASGESLVLVPLPRGAASVSYAFDDAGGLFLGIGATAHPTSTMNMGDPSLVLLARTGGWISLASIFDLVLDVQWPFFGAPGTFGPTIALSARFRFGSFEPPS